MKKLLLLLLLLCPLARATPLSQFNPASALDGSEVIMGTQAGGSVKITPAQIRTFVLEGAGAITLSQITDMANSVKAAAALAVNGSGGLATYSATLQRAANLSDVATPATARDNLGLAAIAASGSASDLTVGTLPSARFPVGTTSTTVAAGNDTRFPSSISGLRKGNGAGSADTLAVSDVDFISVGGLLSKFCVVSAYNSLAWATFTSGSSGANLQGPFGSIGSGSSYPACGMIYSVNPVALGNPGNSILNIDFSKPFWIKIPIVGYGSSVAPNSTYRFSIGKTGFPPSPGDLTSSGIGFDLALDTANVGHFYGVVYGSALVKSSSSKSSLSLNGVNNEVRIYSAGSGTFYFFVNGTLVETLTGGPTGAVNNYLSLEVYNVGDAVSSGGIYTGQILILQP